MKTIKFVIDNETQHFKDDTFWIESLDDTMVQFLNVNSKHFHTARDAKKLMSDYAVTELPFALFIDENGDEYAACYSEEGPITLDRINAKL
jgi:hypothetical protein